MRFFSHHFILCLMTGFVALTIGCSNLSDDAGKLVGAWEHNDGIVTATMTFSEDITFSMKAVSGFGSGTTTGAWRIEGERLIFRIETDSYDKNMIGKEIISRLVKIDDASLVLRNQKANGEWDKPNTYKRVK